MTCFVGIGLQFRKDSDEYLDRMAIPISFETQELAQQYLNEHPHLEKWGAMFGYGDCEVDELFMSNWAKWCKRNNFNESI